MTPQTIPHELHLTLQDLPAHKIAASAAGLKAMRPRTGSWPRANPPKPRRWWPFS
jgi:hypothetical protein